MLDNGRAMLFPLRRKPDRDGGCYLCRRFKCSLPNAAKVASLEKSTTVFMADAMHPPRRSGFCLVVWNLRPIPLRLSPP